MKDITKFKDEILFREINNEERFSSIYKHQQAAEKIVRWKEDRIEGADHSPIIFAQLAKSIIYLENIILLCAEFKKRGVWDSLQGCVHLEDNYYEDNFKSKIADAKKIMKKLRPYILEYTKNWSVERKLRDLYDEEIGKYYRHWYLSVPDGVDCFEEVKDTLEHCANI